ncbi:MAG: hypothetical protein DRI94_11370 [Bacteroidetes bacterium]|nr:MAG: hypothetical protein DRI94_11370 [Bacteroidota bacterium]
MNTKWILILLMGVFFVTFAPKTTKACEIEFEITKGKKDAYQKGDTLIVLVKVALTHRACPVALEKTKFKLKGLKVIKSTKWKQTSANKWNRKLMIVVTDTSGGKLNLAAIRECDKDGGFGTLKLDIKK